MNSLNNATTPAQSGVDGLSHERETGGEFEMRVASAIFDGAEWIEASPDLITRAMRGKKWDPPGYIVYKGIKVCALGTLERIQAEESQSLEARLMPKSPATPTSQDQKPTSS